MARTIGILVRISIQKHMMKFVEVVDRQFVGNVNEFIRFGDVPIQSHFCIVDMFGINPADKIMLTD